MGWLILLLFIVGAIVLYWRTSSGKHASSRPTSRQPTRPAKPPPVPSLAAEEARIRREVEAEASRMESQIEVEVDAEAVREAAAVAFEEEDIEPLPELDRVVSRKDYVPKEDEGRSLTRTADQLPNLYLADAGDRLAIWSPIDGGGLINPKGPGLRQLGLYASYARGADHYRSAYRAADLRKGNWIDLVREPENPHDKNAVAMCAPGSRIAFAYVQRGRAPAVARRIDAGEDMAAVSMRGPGKGRDDDSTFVLVGSRTDLAAMLNA